MKRFNKLVKGGMFLDSGTHLVMGFGLFALAHLDPALTNQPDTAQAVALGAIIGSQAPDSDTLYRLFNNPAYIRNHRGFSHSLPMLIVWPTLITVVSYLIWPQANILHVFLWTLIAVLLHVFIDLFNTYGTQAFRPLSKRWIAWDIINIFDPFIFIVHLAGLFLWGLTRHHPGQIFLCVYMIIAVYLISRSLKHRKLLRWVKEEAQEPGAYKVTPTIHPQVWNVVLTQPHRVKMGEIQGKRLLWTGQLALDQYDHPAVAASKQTTAIASFLSFTSYGFPQVFERDYGYEVRWVDVRYHHKKHFPFFAVALLDKSYQVKDTYVGWLSKDQLEKKIHQLIS